MSKAQSPCSSAGHPAYESATGTTASFLARREYVVFMNQIERDVRIKRLVDREGKKKKKSKDLHEEPHLLRRLVGWTFEDLGGEMSGERHKLASHEAVLALVFGTI